jgi:glucan phosphoethanolaminetransferase (alkaline phosphatase superfamily)
MVTFSPEVYRAYLAAIAMIAAMTVARSQHSLEWSADVALTAGFSDLLVVGFLVMAYGLVKRLAGADSLAGRINRRVHLTLAFAIIVVTGLAQALFLKTGEVLNPDILLFFLRRSRELSDVATGAVDRELLLILLLCIGIVLLGSLRFSRRLLTGVQYFVFMLPIGLVSAGSMVSSDAGTGERVAVPEHLAAKNLYRGQYEDFAERQLAWNKSATANWRKGILTGMSVGSALGNAEYQALARQQTAEAIYAAPHAPQPAAKPPNILFVLLESVRHNALGIHAEAGDKLASDTPFLDDIARQGWLVERAYTTVPHTSKALVGIYCGTFARLETDITEALPGNLPLTCLPRLLAGAGYRSAHFQTAPGGFEDRLQFLANVGFDDRFTQESIAGTDWTKLGYLGVDDRAMIAPAIDWMRSQAAQGRPFFASLLTITAHHPYVSPGNIQAVHDAAQARDAYVKAVRYTDEVVRELFAEMRRHGLLENTLVVITGDHGEAFSEHGQIAHNGVGYEEGIRVPLILYGPALGGPKTIKGLRQHIDIMPTVLDLAGIGFSGRLPGKSLRGDPSGHSDLITSCFYHDYCLTHLSADGGKLLYFYGKRTVEMYGLTGDPMERRNLYAADTHDNAAQRLGIAVKMKKSYELVYQPTQEPDAAGRRSSEPGAKVGADDTARQNVPAVTMRTPALDTSSAGRP